MKKSLKKAVKRSRKRLEQIDDPTAWVDTLPSKPELNRVRADNALIDSEMGLLHAENSILKAQLESVNNGCTNRLEDGYPKGYYCTYSLDPGEAKIFYGNRVEASDLRMKELETEIERLKTGMEEYKANA